MPLRILREQPARGGERNMIPHAGQHVERFTLLRCRITDAVSRNQRYAETPRRVDLRLVARFFFAVHVPLNFGKNVPPSEYIDQALQLFRRRRPALYPGVGLSPPPPPLPPPPPPPPHPPP